MPAALVATDEDFLADPLKRAKLELTKRQIRREDLAMAIAERQLIRDDEHRQALAQVIGAVITFLDTLPDRMERQLSLPGVVVQGLRQAVDSERDNLYEVLMEAERNRRGSKTVKVSMDHLAPKAKDGSTVTASKKRTGRPTNVERAMKMEILS